MLTVAQRQALARAEQAARLQVRDRLNEFAVTLWNGLGSWRDADIDRFVSLIVPRVLAGQVTIARLTDTYLARVLEVAPLGTVDVATLRNGVTPDEVYRRPATSMYTALASGATFTDALKTGADRLVNLVLTDAQLAMQHQARRTLLGSSGADAFRRTLTGRENCALCMIASTQRYWKGDLLPIHPACDCGVEPLAPGEANEQVIDPARLEQTHNWVDSFAGRDDVGARDLGLGKLVDYTADGNTGTRQADFTELIITNDHGELGPTLGWRHQNFDSLA